MKLLKTFSLSLFVLGSTLFGTAYAQEKQEVKIEESVKAAENTAADTKEELKEALTQEGAKSSTETSKEVVSSDKDKKAAEDKKKKGVDSKIITGMIFNLIGGLGIFLLGMRYMSDGLQTIAGSSLKRLIKAVTDNRFMACGVGVMVTLLVQSSSVTTVMAVGFVNSTIMELHQAIGIILGANIGTTITGWVLFLKIGKWGLPILGVAAFVYLFNRKESVKYFALAVMGIGMVFFGLELMKN
ncbi:MAG: Na/Pi symporter, partial [Lentisphaeraceae bacterium]|nr:Na/Pi symporter [Lentisphaeraceae bacterium]